MKLYSDFYGRRATQIAGDVFALLVLIIGITVAIALHDAIAAFASVGRNVEQSGTDLSATMDDIGDTLSEVPLIGEAIRAPFDAAGGAGDTLAAAGSTWQQSVHTVAAMAGWTVAALVVLVLLFGWILPRVSGVARRTEAARLASSPSSTDLLALRALAKRSPQDLNRIDADVVGAWRRGDGDVIQQLAALQLKAAGVRATPRV